MMSGTKQADEIADKARAEMLTLTATIDDESRRAQILAADAEVARAKTQAATVRRSHLVREIVEAAGLSATTHGVNVERGVVKIVELEGKA